MANKYFKLKLAIAGAAIMTAFTGCDLKEKFYSQTAPDNFYTSAESIYTILGRPFSHWQWYFASGYTDGGSAAWMVNELVSDTFCMPRRNGADWYDGGIFYELHYHTWSAESTFIWMLYDSPMQGVARCLAAINDLSGVDYSRFNLTEVDKADHIAQLNALMAFFYKEGLDHFGGLPIYTSSLDDLKARSTKRELYDYVESLLLEGVSGSNPTLKIKQPGQEMDGYISRATGAALLAQLYFNAEAYIGENHFAECAKICEDIIGGVYGSYSIESKWQTPFGFENMKSPELLWSAPGKTAVRNLGSWFDFFYPGNVRGFFGLDTGSPWNGTQLQPSRSPEGDNPIYTQWKLGTPFAKFSEGDLRAGPFGFIGMPDDWVGMFVMEDMVSPVNPGYVASGSPTKLVDFIARVSRGEYVSTMAEAEANSGYRLVKYPMADRTQLAKRWDAHIPVIRLTEIHYMLAECKMRAGDKAGAATLINNIRKRYFENGADPNPVTAENLDDYRMLDEWMIEFLGEAQGRRRTDLIRFNKFVTEDWWDHTASNNASLNLFPIPNRAINGNPLLEQNPGY